MSIQVKQLIIKTTVKDNDDNQADAISELELDHKISGLKAELSHQISRLVEQQIAKQWEP